jgi:adenylate cyclase
LRALVGLWDHVGEGAPSLVRRSGQATDELQTTSLKTMPQTLSGPALYGERVVKTVLFVDLVESVRLIEADETSAVARWLQFAATVENEILPQYRGRLIKNLGDGLMLEFPSVKPAVSAAFAIQRACHEANVGIPPDRQMHLRIGAHVSELIADERDLYGHGVNLTARLTTLAGPDEIVVSAAVRDELTPTLDADVEDLGECYLKHLTNPVRAYRVGPPGSRPVIEPGSAAAPDLLPTVAVIPFTARTSEPEHSVVGEVLADDIIAALSHTSEMHVISRLSTTAFRDRIATLRDVSEHLRANYVLSGSYHVSRTELSVHAQLAETKSGQVIWSKRLKGHVTGVLVGQDTVIDRIVSGVCAAMMAREVQRAQSQALPTLESYTLLVGAISLMHRLSAADFERAKQMLEALIERAPRQATPLAWLANWHVLRVQQGWSEDPVADRKLALDSSRHALDIDAHCALALVIDGFVHTNLLKRLDIGQQRYDLALSVNPNDSLAWLLKGTLHAFKGEGDVAVRSTQKALRLSPLDPMRYFYESLAATAAMSAGQYERAIELARRSLRLNRTHTSTYRALAIAQARLGRLADARRTVAELLRLEPTLTVKKWLERSPTSGYETAQVWSDALRRAGLPE